MNPAPGSEVPPASGSRLAVYGEMRRGGAEHHVVSTVGGTWRAGVVKGWLVTLDWGPAEGIEGIIVHPDGNPIEVDVVDSDRLDRAWKGIERFLGPGYRRRIVPVSLAAGPQVTDGEASAHIFEVITDQ